MTSAFADLVTESTEPSQYVIKPMDRWGEMDVDFVLTDPPFGIDFGDSKSNYARDSGRVVDGYVEWEKSDYRSRVRDLLDVISRTTHEDGHGCIFSGWNNSHKIHQSIIDHDELSIEGKLYWEYNFAPYCTRRPAHNVYEIFWVTKSDDYYYTNECTHSHCTEGEANLSVISVKRNYIQEMPKYPTRLPPEIVRVLLEHFTREDDVVLDPLAGSGTVGIVADELDRSWLCGDSNQEAKEVFDETYSEVDAVVAD